MNKRWITFELMAGGQCVIREDEILCLEDERGQEGISRVYLQDGQWKYVKGKAADIVKIIGA